MTSQSLIFSVSNGYNPNQIYALPLPKASVATLYLFGAGGGGGCGTEIISPPCGEEFYTSMGGGGGGGGTYMELSINPQLLTGNSVLYFSLGAGGTGGVHNKTTTIDYTTLHGGNGSSTFITYTFGASYPPSGYYETYSALGGSGGDYGTLDASNLHGSGGNGGAGYTFNGNLPPNTGSNFTVNEYKSFGGGGGLYLSPPDGPLLNVGASGGIGYRSDFTIPQSYFNGTDGTFSNVNTNVHAGFGGGSLASIGGTATSYGYKLDPGPTAAFGITFLLNGAGSGGSPGNATPINRQNTITNPIAGAGAGYNKYGYLWYTDATAPAKAVSGGGGGGGVGGITNPPLFCLSTYEINGQDAGAGGNGKIILNYTT